MSYGKWLHLHKTGPIITDGVVAMGLQDLRSFDTVAVVVVANVNILFPLWSGER